LEEICTSIGILEKGHLVRVGKIEEILHQAPDGQAGSPTPRVIRIRLSMAGFPLESWLTARPGVSHVAASGLGTLFQFTGSEGDLSELVKALVTAGAPLAAVEQPGMTLEEVYSRISNGEVM
jgi:ABC-2 type transport system ATP-binding protein